MLMPCRTARFRPALALLALLLAGQAQAEIRFAAPLTFAAGSSPSAIASGDLTGDSVLDLAVVNRASDDAYVYAGDGSGGFVFLDDFAVGNFPQGVITAHFDADANLDLATTAVPFNSGTVSAWPGNGDGSFQTPFVSVTDDGPRAVLAARIDGDLALDLVTANVTRGNISTFLGDGDGTFGAEIRTAVGPSTAFPTDLAIADFNEDGDLDVVTSNAQSVDDSLGLLFGNGDGSFSLSTPLATGCTRPESVVAGDFDGDQNADLAVACFFSDEVVVRLGDGLGGFGSPQPYDLAPADNPSWILSADLDGDGVEDLVTANNGSFSVLRGLGDGTFEAPVAKTAVGSFLAAVASDFDGDGRLDLAFANFGLNEVWVYRNTTFQTVPTLAPALLPLLAVLLVAGARLRLGRGAT